MDIKELNLLINDLVANLGEIRNCCGDCSLEERDDLEISSDHIVQAIEKLISARDSLYNKEIKSVIDKVSGGYCSRRQVDDLKQLLHDKEYHP